ncbi:28623_t:CDS:1 [Dentiscutata erythropus]|uniref:28623_t:CDS:1 n=1 Tax=Dentiscutata erythropus TaxID=1348616 RepID=A0A9N9I2G5_9GLOM|nr:28623_t:CDS:1 [Dentiscutata erythropus]
MIIYGDYTDFNDNQTIQIISPNRSYVSKICVDEFSVSRCNDLKLSNEIVINVFLLLNLISFIGCILAILMFKLLINSKNQQTNTFIVIKFLYNHIIYNIVISNFMKISNCITIVVLTIYPAVVSGYILSTDSTTTKIAFLICSLSLSRLIDHFGDNEPKKVMTMISFYLHWTADMIVKDRIENAKKPLAESKENLKTLADQIHITDEKIKEDINKIKEILENQEKELSEIIINYEEGKIEDKVKNIKTMLKIQMEDMKKLKNQISEENLNQGLDDEIKRLEDTNEKLDKVKIYPYLFKRTEDNKHVA